jgi:hypothetical protein
MLRFRLVLISVALAAGCTDGTPRDRRAALLVGMPHDLMIVCEQRKQYKVANSYEWRWTKVAVSEIVGLPAARIRCLHCHGAVRLHKQQVPHGPQDHVEHRSRADSEGCPGGHYFMGIPRMSSRPVS